MNRHDSRSPDDLSSQEWRALVDSVFRPGPADRRLLLLTDLPDPEGGRRPDHPAWRARRSMVAAWAERLASAFGAGDEDDRLEVVLGVYRNVGTNNADLPARAWRVDPASLASSNLAHGGLLDDAAAVDLHELLESADLVLAPTELSTTAPLKLLAPRLGFRAATMPGFRRDMLPALRLDYDEVDRRVRRLAALLTAADRAELAFDADGLECRLTLDLRGRSAHASGGLVREVGQAGNLPSGEAYIVPYEGERPGEPSRSAGTMPVELDGELLLYTIEQNRAVAVRSRGLADGGEGPRLDSERNRLRAEPAYANLAELGLGVLGPMGVEPIGVVLLDEKLGLHIAFGRSDHFGGTVGAADFTSPDTVVHIDRVYLPSLQPRVTVRAVDLVDADGTRRELMRDGEYVVALDL
ncbi:MAG: hypothetical protein AAGC60_23605 [Acidobacteriota bacterium]